MYIIKSWLLPRQSSNSRKNISALLPPIDAWGRESQLPSGWGIVLKSSVIMLNTMMDAEQAGWSIPSIIQCNASFKITQPEHSVFSCRSNCNFKYRKMVYYKSKMILSWIINILGLPKMKIIVKLCGTEGVTKLLNMKIVFQKNKNWKCFRKPNRPLMFYWSQFCWTGSAQGVTLIDLRKSP